MFEIKKLRRINLVLFTLVLLGLPACGGEETEEAASPTSAPATATSTSTPNMEATALYLAPTETHAAQLTEDSATRTAVYQNKIETTQTARAERTATAQAATEAARATATAQVQEMQDIVQGLYDDNMLSSLEGSYYQLDDYTNTWAQLDWYWRTPLVIPPIISFYAQMLPGNLQVLRLMARVVRSYFDKAGLLTIITRRSWI
ncbi:MAG: hypothetical protein FVQ83_16350 [Chloroflexi bacterium]|nr:hypothetical protein [Chloroflexota bacterium]